MLEFNVSRTIMNILYETPIFKMCLALALLGHTTPPNCQTYLFF
uniref:Uncharacterized protein n=1 Tax=Anguilla anguilla TaxID=7936 RepID=A0A0E9T6Y4_ANGAN